MQLIKVLERSLSNAAEDHGRTEIREALQALERLRQAESLIPYLERYDEGVIKTLMKQYIQARRKAYAVGMTLPDTLWEDVTITIPREHGESLKFECDRLSKLNGHPLTRGSCKTLKLSELFRAADALDFVILPLDVVDPMLYMGEGEAIVDQIARFEQKLKAKHWQPYVLGPSSMFRPSYYARQLVRRLGKSPRKQSLEVVLYGTRELYEAGGRILSLHEVYPGENAARKIPGDIVRLARVIDNLIAQIIRAKADGIKITTRNLKQPEFLGWHLKLDYEQLELFKKMTKIDNNEFGLFVREMYEELASKDKATSQFKTPPRPIVMHEDPILFAIPDYVTSLPHILPEEAESCPAVVGAAWGPDLGKEMLALIAPFFPNGKK